jgi:hypothetical protein
MTVIADWAFVPKQAEVLEHIRQARDGFTTFVLCTPTSILPAARNGDRSDRNYKN